MSSWFSLTLFRIKPDGQSIYTENLTVKLRNSIHILACREKAKSGFEQPGPGAPPLGSAKSVYGNLAFRRTSTWTSGRHSVLLNFPCQRSSLSMKLSFV